jgi:hypothetical protein
VRDALGERGGKLRLALAAVLVLVIGQGAIGAAQASTTVNVNPAGPVSDPNEFPFGRPDVWPQMGFVYKNIPAFNLKTGDTIAFDLGAQNNVDIQLQISMAATTVNGGEIPGPYTTVVNNTQVPLNPRGNTVMGDYELQFTSEAPFNFTGGGLIIRFSSPGGAFATDIQQDSTLINDANGTDSSGFFVERFFNDSDGLPPYTNSDAQGIGGFRLTLLDAIPTPLTPAPPGGPGTTAPRKCKKKKHKRAAVTAKKCKKKRR